MNKCPSKILHIPIDGPPSRESCRSKTPLRYSKKRSQGDQVAFCIDCGYKYIYKEEIKI